MFIGKKTSNQETELPNIFYLKSYFYYYYYFQGLYTIIKFGYAVVVISWLLMVWISLNEAKEIDGTQYPPCHFNPLCSCSKSIPDLGIVRCKDVHLPLIPQVINSSKVFMLYLENIGLRDIEPYFLQSTSLYKLCITKNLLSSIPEEAFLGLERSLWELILSENELTTVPNKSLRYLQKLRHLDLSGNDIIEIAADDWRGLENSLETLILSNNAINSLPADAFSGLPQLDTLDLNGNNLREIDPSVFRDGMGKLTHVYLSDNQLSVIPYQALQPLKLLKYLDLSYNIINKMQAQTDPLNPSQEFNYDLSLDTLRLDYNQLTIIESAAFQYFDVLNKTYLDGNPLLEIQESAFMHAVIKELYIRKCGLNHISPLAFGGLENSLQILDLSGNNISSLSEEIFHRFDVIRTLVLRGNSIKNLNPTQFFSGLQYTLLYLDLSGTENEAMSIPDLKRLRQLRKLSLSKISHSDLTPDLFQDFGRDLEELSINFANLKSIKNNAFQRLRSLRKLDLSENLISVIEANAFEDVAFSLTTLILAHGFASTLQELPLDSFRYLKNLKELDISNNKLKSLADTSFHFLKKLRVLEVQDNVIENVLKGTFQGDTHSELEIIYFSFNHITSIQQHTFVNLASLEQLHLDDNRIENIERRAFMNLAKLKRLNLKGNRISTISYEAFQNLPELEDLDMSYNNINNFEFSMFDLVGTLSMLRVNVSHNKIRELSVNFSFTFSQDSGVGGLHSNIKVLDLSYNNITSISKQYFQPAILSLTHLYLSNNKIINATKDVFGNIDHLQVLDISYNQLGEIDFDTFRNTRRLQILRASHNNIVEVSYDLFRSLSNLRIVDLSHNKLRILPDNLFREEGLESLDLSHNALNRIHLSSINSLAASTLCELDLSWNSISSISHSDAFAKFKSLTFLDLSYNRLVQMDDAVFTSLPRLLSLDLSHNTQLILETGRIFDGIEDSLLHLALDNVSLTYVPELPLPSLISLSLAYNELPTVPPEIAANISSLQRLNLNYNDLSAVPVVTHSLTQLRQLQMSANPITALSNTSLLGVADHLEELDITNFDLNILENGILSKMHALRKLRISIYENIKNFNIPRLLEFNNGLRNLEVYVEKEVLSLGKILSGTYPSKLKTITLSGKGLKTLDFNMFEGVRSPSLTFCLRNTSLSKIPTSFFSNMGSIKNFTLDVRDNEDLRAISKAFNTEKPGEEPFMINLKLGETKWTCDCSLG
ncbi:antigen bsp putative-related [Holotrichia oblita]|uniref:Antigen bsp putative-related n=1 Tax=Holotrichia oblita TaxID=644536 RepID=A0ACB9SZ72_HOLOL|nr:antigen bsp putative-related [Holotrichia oblita]